MKQCENCVRLDKLNFECDIWYKAELETMIESSCDDWEGEE